MAKDMADCEWCDKHILLISLHTSGEKIWVHKDTGLNHCSASKDFPNVGGSKAKPKE